MFDKLEALRLYIENLGHYKQVILGTDFIINNNALPMCLISVGNGKVEDYTKGDYALEIIGFFHENNDLEEAKLNAMQQMITDLEEYDPIRLIDPAFSFDSDALSVFGIDLPIMAPYGAYRLSYEIDY